MKSNYCILSVLIRPEIKDKISIGIILMDESNVYFRYSRNKLSIIKSLLTANNFGSLNDILFSISSLSERDDANHNQSPFSSSYIQYLSRYNNNILEYSPLKEIEMPANEVNSLKLYDLYLDSDLKISSVESNPFDVKLNKFKIQRIKDLQLYFNIDTEITLKEVEGLIVPVSVTFIGQNEVPTFIQSLDFERHTEVLVKNISEILFLQNAFRKTKMGSCAMAITHEPNKFKYPKQHDIWMQLKNTNNGIRQFDINEVDSIIEYAKVHHVQPFLRQ
jgi:hypothetical protein